MIYIMSDAYGYIRCIYDNLGDIALDIGVRNLLKSLPNRGRKIKLIPYSVDSRKLLLHQLIRGCLPFKSWILGGGTLIFSHSAWFYDILSLYIQEHTPFCCLGAGIMPPEFFKQPQWVIDFWVNEILSKMRFIGVRGNQSKSILERYGINSTVIGDPALWIPDEFVGEYNPANTTIGINWGKSGYSYGHKKDSRTYFEQTIFVLSKNFHGLKFFAVCQKDIEFFLSLDISLREKLELVKTIEPKAFAEHISECKFFVGMKLHSVLLSLMAGVPSIMVSYQPKCDEVMDELGLSEYSLRLDAFKVDILLQRIQLILNLDVLTIIGEYKKRMERVIVDKVPSCFELI